MNLLDYIRDFLPQIQFEIIVFSYFIVSLGLLQNLVYLLQIPMAGLELFRAHLKPQEDYDWWLMTSDTALPISIIIPAYNEEVTIINTVDGILAAKYPLFEVIVVNDGSADNTLEVLIERYHLVPIQRYCSDELPHAKINGVYGSSVFSNLVVVDKVNGGRSDAINTGITAGRFPIFCTLDADSLLDSKALLSVMQPFIEEPERVVASGGTVGILNGCEVENGIIKQLRLPKKILPLFQVSEYIRAFLMGRLAYSHLGIVTILSGAFSLFRRDMAIAVGGFSTKTICEDFELVMKIHRYCRAQKRDYAIRFVPEPVCWTEAPENLRVLGSQRIRWQQGGLEVFFAHLRMLFNPRYGRIGFLAMPLVLIFDVIAPLAEVCGYILLPLFYLLDAVNEQVIVMFVCLFIIMGSAISVLSLVLEEISLCRFRTLKSLLILGFVAVVENFGYRQLNNYWRIVGWWRFLRNKQEWGTMTRVGTGNDSST